jgi:hypothetical protein
MMAATTDEKSAMAFKRPLTFKFVEKKDGLVIYDLTWPELRAKAPLFPRLDPEDSRIVQESARQD